jgi:hypothetical protein
MSSIWLLQVAAVVVHSAVVAEQVDFFQGQRHFLPRRTLSLLAAEGHQV